MSTESSGCFGLSPGKLAKIASESLLEVADRLDPNSVRIADRAEPDFLFFAQIGSAGHVVR